MSIHVTPPCTSLVKPFTNTDPVDSPTNTSIAIITSL